MASDTSSEQDESGSTVALLGKCFGVGLALGIVGMAIFLGLMLGAGITLSLVGLVPPFLAGLGISMVAGHRGGVLTGLIAVITGQGPVLLMYGLLYAVFGGVSVGRGDVVILMFGFVIAYKMGTGSDEESTSEESADVDSEAVAEALEDEDADLDDVADALAEEGSADGTTPLADAAPAASDPAPADGGESAAEVGTDDGSDDDGTASDWVNDD